MSEPSYSPRTVAGVALASLVGGFVVVFGGGTLVLRSRGTDPIGAPPGGVPPLPPTIPVEAGVSTVTERASPEAADPTVTADAEAPSTETANAPEGPPPVAAGSVTVGAPSISRCFDAGPPTPIPGASCGQLTALQQHVASRATQLAACARGGHGRLALVLDFRFSTAFVRGWGSPASTVPRAGDVTSCVKNAVFPLPFATIPHEHDRYLAVVPIDF